jgi:diguanylate cyclase (GGDEF)-like protein
VISIKRYLDADTIEVADEPVSDDLRLAVLDAYRATLQAIGKSAVRACHAPGCDLEQQLSRLEANLARNPTQKTVEEIQTQVEDRLDRWGQLTSDHLKSKADEVRELLIMLASTAESVGERDHRYNNQFGTLTTELKAIADLDDLTIIRSSLVRKASELRICVEKMTQEGLNSLTELRTRVSLYETKLKAVEQLAMRDPLTGLANRRGAEGRMEWYVAQRQIYCVVILDLDRFKVINDKHGHAAGDDLLRKFSDELQKNMRSTDMVARWGGDEFIVVLACDLERAQPQVDRIRQWVLGKYTVEKTGSKEVIQVQVGASIGVAQWVPGMTTKQVIAQADAAMYKDKKAQSKKKA